MYKPGTWIITVSHGYEPNGKKKRIVRTFHCSPEKTQGAQRKLAEKEAAKLETDLSRHVLSESGKIKLSEVFEEFKDHHQMAQSTKKWYQHQFKRIIPELGSIYVQDLTPQQIRKFYKKLSETDADTARSKTGKLSGETRLHYHRALSSVLSFALKSGYITINPMQAIDPPRSDTKEMEIMEDEEIAEMMNIFENYPDPMWKAFFILYMNISCRPGELIGLDWTDIKDNELTIRAGANRENGKTVRTDHPKTKSSERTIILSKDVLEVLESWKKIQAEQKLKFGKAWPEESRKAVFTGLEGYRLDLSSPTQKWRKIQKKHDLKDCPLYSLRHTGASLLIANGATVREISARLGHSRTSTTLDKYTHLFEKAAQHTTDLMSEALNQAKKSNQKKKPQTIPLTRAAK